MLASPFPSDTETDGSNTTDPPAAQANTGAPDAGSSAPSKAVTRTSCSIGCPTTPSISSSLSSRSPEAPPGSIGNTRSRNGDDNSRPSSSATCTSINDSSPTFPAEQVIGAKPASFVITCDGQNTNPDDRVTVKAAPARGKPPSNAETTKDAAATPNRGSSWLSPDTLCGPSFNVSCGTTFTVVRSTRPSGSVIATSDSTGPVTPCALQTIVANPNTSVRNSVGQVSSGNPGFARTSRLSPACTTPSSTAWTTN